MKMVSKEIRELAVKLMLEVPPRQIAETLGYQLNTINR